MNEIAMCIRCGRVPTAFNRSRCDPCQKAVDDQRAARVLSEFEHNNADTISAIQRSNV